MTEGTVKWYDKRKGYGFIASSDQPDIFLHYTSLAKPSIRLKDGDMVSFDIVAGEKGPRAENVKLKDSDR